MAKAGRSIFERRDGGGLVWRIGKRRDARRWRLGCGAEGGYGREGPMGRRWSGGRGICVDIIWHDLGVTHTVKEIETVSN